MTLKMNRDIGGTWKAECLHRDLSQALANEGGTWNNQTVVGYYQDDRSTANTETIYIACYNDDLLFTTERIGSNSNSGRNNSNEIRKNAFHILYGQKLIFISRY